MRPTGVQSGVSLRVRIAVWRVLSSVRPRRPSNPVHRADAQAVATHPFRPLSVRSFPAVEKPPSGLNGCMKSSSTAIGWRRASTTGACNCDSDRPRLDRQISKRHRSAREPERQDRLSRWGTAASTRLGCRLSPTCRLPPTANAMCNSSITLRSLASRRLGRLGASAHRRRETAHRTLIEAALFPKPAGRLRVRNRRKIAELDRLIRFRSRSAPRSLSSIRRQR